MSQFDSYATSEYVENMRKFLDMKKRGFVRDAGLVRDPQTPRKGRLPAYPAEAIANIEALVNAKAARCEADDTSLGERFRLARDYKGLTDAAVARDNDVTRELVRRWGENINRPMILPQLAVYLNVPETWLEHGGMEHLPANSHLGVRVGEENRQWREELYRLTAPVLAELNDGVEETYVQAYLENAIMTRPDLAHAARRAGGRWQWVSGVLLFSPWVPIEEHGLARRLWSDVVEDMIEEELTRQHSVYAAWHSLKARCEEMGLSSADYPKLISLHKRVEKERERTEKFGVDLNAMVAQSVERHPELRVA